MKAEVKKFYFWPFLLHIDHSIDIDHLTPISLDWFYFMLRMTKEKNNRLSYVKFEKRNMFFHKGVK